MFYSAQTALHRGLQNPDWRNALAVQSSED